MRTCIMNHKLIFLALLSMTWSAGTQAAAPSSGPAEKICLAVLAPDVQADLPAADHKALGAMIDTLLTDALAQDKDFVLVDRRALDKVLAEKKSKFAAGDVAEPLKPFWAAGVLISTVVQKKDPKAAPDRTVWTIFVNAVVAQTGQVLAEDRLTGEWKGGQWRGKPAPATPAFEGFGQKIQQGFAAVRGKPTVGIGQGRIKSSLTRLQWMADDVHDRMTAVVSLDRRVNLLEPRHPASTREERLLRVVMGLSAAKGDDPTAGLPPTCDCRARIELTESPAAGVSYENTPIELKLTWTGAAGEKEWSGKAVVATYDGLQSEAATWLAAQVKDVPRGGAPADENPWDTAKAAAEELVTLRYWADQFSRVGGRSLWLGGHLDPEGESIREKICQQALRVCHLDPACEEAAYYAAVTIDNSYLLRGLARSDACADRELYECTRYLQQFGKDSKVPAHRLDVLDKIGGLYSHVCDLRTPGGGWDMAGPPEQERMYHFASPCFRGLAEANVIHLHQGRDTMNNLWGLAHLLGQAMFVNCPKDKLDEELSYWLEFWRTQIEPLHREDAPDWDYVQLGYFAMKKDPQALRALFNKLAKKHPLSDTKFWGSPDPPRRSGPKPFIVSKWLKVSGDPEWKTWRPAGGQTEGEVYYPTFNDWTDFISSLCPPAPIDSAYKVGPLPVDLTISLPAKIVAHGRDARYMGEQAAVQLIGIVGGQMWLVSPGPLSQCMSNLRKDCQLYRVGADEAERGGQAQPEEVPWPEHAVKNGPIVVTCWFAREDVHCPQIWIGTRYHGMARFQKEDGKWSGRWFTEKDGLPVEFVFAITSCVHQGKEKLLVTGKTAELDPVRGFHWVQEPAGGSVTVLLERGGPTDFYHELAAEMSDGTLLPMSIYDRQGWPEADLKDIKAFRSIADSPVSLWRAGEGKSRRLWWNCGGAVCELDAKTLKPGSQRISSQSLAGSIYADKYAGNFLMNTGRAPAMWTYHTAPFLGDFVQATDGGRVVWSVWPNWQSWTRRPGLLAYCPPKDQEQPWAANDRWLGPFTCPDRGGVSGLLKDAQGRLWVSSSEGTIYRVDVQGARKTGPDEKELTTEAWQKRYAETWEQGGWKPAVQRLLSLGQEQAALDALSKVSDGPAPPAPAGRPAKTPPAVELAVYRAAAIAHIPGQVGKAIEIYEGLVADSQSPPAAKAFAFANELILLYRSEQWAKFLATEERFVKMFPDDKHKGGSQLDWYTADARKKMSAQSRPASAPAANPRTK